LGSFLQEIGFVLGMLDEVGICDGIRLGTAVGIILGDEEEEGRVDTVGLDDGTGSRGTNS
jgi:hypothetical protein